MQVNSNLTLNTYDGASLSPSPIPAGVSASTPSTLSANEKTITTNEQYQASLDTKKALDTVTQNTIINLGVGVNALPVSTQGGITNSPLPTNTNTGNSVSDKFLESFSKMLEGFLANMNKLLDSFLSKVSDLISKGSGTTSNTGTPSSGTTGSSGSSPSRVIKTWEQKAGEYVKADEKGMISESDLQEAVAKYQIYQKSDKGEQVFISELEKAKASTSNRQSALKTALKNTVASGAITQAEADYVYSISFKASQFDAELDKISTAKSTGGLSAQNGIQLGAVNLSMIRAGQATPEPRSIDSLSE